MGADPGRGGLLCVGYEHRSDFKAHALSCGQLARSVFQGQAAFGFGLDQNVRGQWRWHRVGSLLAELRSWAI